MVDLNAAGQTTIIYKLKLGEMVTTIMEIGRKMETVEYKNLSFAMRRREARTEFSVDGANTTREHTVRSTPLAATIQTGLRRQTKSSSKC